MTCVWDALRTKIRAEDLRTLLGVNNCTAHELVKSLKAKNKATIGAKWQGTSLTTQQMSENMKWIENHNINSITNGYEMGTCDPYILLVSYILNIRIHHQYLNTTIVYDPPDPPRYTLTFSSNQGHFW